MTLPPPEEGFTALVTGASSGIGAEFARGLASRGHGVTLVARRAERLSQLATELAERHGVRAEVITADLAEEAGRERVASDLEARGLGVAVLVNSAGFGIYRPFAQSDREGELRQVRLLVEAVVDLDARYLPAMLRRDSGAIINMSSTAGFQPLPGNGTYAAAKAFVLFHTEALHEEVRGSGVTVTAVCPGPVATEFQEKSEPLFGDRMPKLVWRGPERIADESLRAVERGKRTIVPGGLAVRSFFAPNRIAPPSLALSVARRVMSRELSRGTNGA
jgi:uncharacterized protein